MACTSILALVTSGTALAQAAPVGQPVSTRSAESQQPAKPASEIVITGSRFGGRTAGKSPTPIDLITPQELQRGGGKDLQASLKVAVPSFSVPQPAASGISDFLQSPTLRGLSTGDLLVLVNGKRRQTNSDLNVSLQIGRGDVAYDFSAIPIAALKRVEVLRDDAAAQYGSDAIAGVINLVLDDSVGYYASAKYGQTTHGDGQNYEADLGAGFKVGEGSLRITAEYIDHEMTNRAEPDTRQQYFGSNGTLFPSGNYGSGTGLTPSNGTLDPREATINRNMWVFGEPAYTNRVLFENFNLPISSNVTFYSFGGLNYLRGVTDLFFRRAGQDETVRLLHPDGFLPASLAQVYNRSIAAGFKGDDLAGFKWDLSTVYGYTKTEQSDINSDNASLGDASPLNFYRGAEIFRQWTNNLDITREIPVGDDSPLKIAFGGEYRRETYALVAGDLDSYINGGVPILDGPDKGKPAPAGAQPNPGITPQNAISGLRNAKSIYAEVEKQFFDRLLIDGSVRHENYSDFGSTTNYKVNGRFEITKGFAVRGAIGTGFRAPALAQIIYNSSTVAFFNGQPIAIRLISTTDPMAPLVGAPRLKPEKSKNWTIGTTFSRGGFSAAVDYYHIKLNDRLALSSAFSSPALTAYLAANGFPGISSVSFVTNGLDTTTKGVDVTADYHRRVSEHDTLSATFAANFNSSRIDRLSGTPAPLAALGITTPLEDLTNQVRITSSAPKSKNSLALNWRHDKFGFSLVNTRYGKVSQVALTGKTPAQVAALIPGYDVKLVPSAPGSANSDIIQTFRADIITDLEVSYDLTKQLTLAVGSSNIFDKFPEKQIASTVASVKAGTNGGDNNGIFPYAYIAPYGTDGRIVYARLSLKF